MPIKMVSVNILRLFNLETLWNAGLECMDRKEFERSIPIWEEAIRRDPKASYSHCSGNAYDNLGEAYIELGQYKEAMGCFKKALAHHFLSSLVNVSKSLFHRHSHSFKWSSKFFLHPLNFANRLFVNDQKLSMPLICTPFRTCFVFPLIVF